MTEKPFNRETSSGVEKPVNRSGTKRPLVPLVLALMLGLAGADWGLRIPRSWLIGALAGLLVILVGLYVWKPSSPQKKLDNPQK